MSNKRDTTEEPPLGMTFREKSLWASALLTLAIYAYYFWRVVALGDSDPARIAGLFVAVVILLIVLQIVVAAALAIHHGKPEAIDERDRRIALVATKVSYYVLMAGVWGALSMCALPVNTFWVAHAALFAIVVAELTRCGTQLYRYRRDA